MSEAPTVRPCSPQTACWLSVPLLIGDGFVLVGFREGEWGGRAHLSWSSLRNVRSKAASCSEVRFLGPFSLPPERLIFGLHSGTAAAPQCFPV